MKPTGPEQAEALAPERRRGEIAEILAAGILRLHARAALPVVSSEQGGPKNPEESGRACLEVSPEVVLTVHSG
jgi:hypothetical protein